MSDKLLMISNLSKSFDRHGAWFGKKQQQVAVRDVSFSVESGKTFGIVGESGSGKTTIARLLSRLIEADSGAILFDGMDMAALSGPALRHARRRIQIVTQDPATAFDPRVRIKSAIAAPIRLHRLRPEREIAKRVSGLFDQVGLSQDLGERFPHELSGGQLQRMAIARALAVEPELLILDEVVSALDVLMKAQILNLLLGLQRDHGMTYVFISHNIADVLLMSDVIGVMFSGRMVERGPERAVFDDPKHPYTRALLSAAMGNHHPRLDIPTALKPALPNLTNTGCHFASRCPLVLPECRAGEPAHRLVGEHAHISACFRTQELRAANPSAVFRRPLSSKVRLRLDLISGANNPSTSRPG